MAYQSNKLLMSIGLQEKPKIQKFRFSCGMFSVDCFGLCLSLFSSIFGSIPDIAV